MARSVETAVVAWADLRREKSIRGGFGDMRIVDFDELETLWRDDEATFQAEADFDSFFASWDVNLDNLGLTFDLAFSNSRSSDMLQ